ncbi:hypothetical protein GP486_000467 [Trichoglossum hirsutum]|uniref:Uncharacterized protein n=1 Tax=Trichoglossum hirsutum TaxID=265104 RepID=A0A9P8LII3_9PEZI|nr:hypothetical protein GP486_000467 [Trichoglossum hirsutum]
MQPNQNTAWQEPKQRAYPQAPQLNHSITHVDLAGIYTISFKSASETDKLLFNTPDTMPRPKRTKVENLRPPSRRVAQRTPAESTTPLRRNPSREASSVTEDNSDDSDGLVTSFTPKRKSQAQASGGFAMMRGGLGFGDVKGAHIRTRPAGTHTEKIGHAGAMERLKMRRDAALKAGKEVECGRTEGEKPTETSADNADGGLSDAKDTPGIESSVLAISNFKRRARQPSILRSAVQDPQDNDGEDVFEPEDESTPLRLSTSTPTLQQGLSYGSPSPLLPGSNSRKRKLTPPQLEAPRSSPPIALDLFSTETQLEHTYSSSSFPEANDQNMENGSQDTRTDSHVLSETMVPPQSSSPAMQDVDVFPDVHPNPEQQEASSQTAKRQCRRPPRKTQTRQADQDEVSGVEIFQSDGEDSTDITTLTRNSRRKDSRRGEAPISTAALQNLLPRRRRRAPPDEFDIIESSDIDSERTRLNPYKNEPSTAPFKKDAKKRQSNSNGRRVGLGKAASKGEKGAPLQNRTVETPATKASRTYSRQASSDKENDGLSSSSAEGDSLAPVDSNEETPNQEESKKGKKILKQLARKFKDVDNWKLDFEEDSASGSSPLGAR